MMQDQMLSAVRREQVLCVVVQSGLHDGIHEHYAGAETYCVPSAGPCATRYADGVEQQYAHASGESDG